jgi:hypothetical protein
MAGGKKKKAADKKKAEADRIRLQYQTATAAAMQQANSRALQTRQATRAQLAHPNQAQPIQQAQQIQQPQSAWPPIKQEHDVDESGEAEESPLNGDADSTDEESDWEEEEQEGDAPPGPKARPNRKNRGLVRWSGMYYFILCRFSVGFLSCIIAGVVDPDLCIGGNVHTPRVCACCVDEKTL